MYYLTSRRGRGLKPTLFRAWEGGNLKLALLVVLPGLIATVASPAHCADAAADYKERAALTQRYTELGLKDPAAAQAEFQTFLGQHADRDAEFLMPVYIDWARFQQFHLKDSKGSLQSLEAARAKFATSPRRPEVDAAWANLLLSASRASEVVTFYEAQWPEILKNGAYVSLAAMPFGKALEAEGKDAKALTIWREAVEKDGLRLLGSDPGEQMLTQFVESLMKEGRKGEALSWAKLNYMLCSFKDAKINRATNLLMRSWVAEEMTQTTAQSFLQSQQNPDSPNPLTGVPLPQLKADDIKAQRAQLQGWQPGRITVTYHLLLGDYRRAMLEARRLVVDKPESTEGVLEVCRVFKAKDLNIKRANAFIAFMKDGTGENPMLAFLKEQPEVPTDAPAQGTVTPQL